MTQKSIENDNKGLVFPKWLVTAIACCFLIITTCCLAGDFENLVLKKFANIDKITKRAIENGNHVSSTL